MIIFELRLEVNVKSWEQNSFKKECFFFGGGGGTVLM